jgi:ribosomal protein S18 acetylase RimI-like enzyme
VEIRRLLRNEAELLRDVRLRALADAPWAFGSSYARELAYPPERWQWFADQRDAVIYVAVEGGTVYGMAGGYVPGQGDSVALWGMWVDPRARGQGLARALVEAVIAWARERGAPAIRLDVTDTERARPAAALYRSLGFAPTGERAPLDSDPTLETIVMTRAP